MALHFVLIRLGSVSQTSVSFDCLASRRRQKNVFLKNIHVMSNVRYNNVCVTGSGVRSHVI